MQILCGTDIIEIQRIKKSIERSGERFLHLIYTPAEIEYCESTKNAKYYHYAGRFAAKEALYKAVSALLPERFGISWGNAQIINDKNGNPKIWEIGATKIYSTIQRTDLSNKLCSM